MWGQGLVRAASMLFLILRSYISGKSLLPVGGVHYHGVLGVLYDVAGFNHLVQKVGGRFPIVDLLLET